MPEKNLLPAIKAYIDKMPSLPTAVTKILDICNDPKTSPADLNKVISLDPVLMGRVMKLINSAYYGLNQEITSLVRAIIMLGINTVKNLALSTAVLGTIGSSKSFRALNMEGFWRHSLCVGVTSKMIAKKRGVDPKSLEEYFIAGLLHDIGKLPLNNRLPEYYVSAMGESDRTRGPLVDAEKAVFGFDHCHVGAMIVTGWKLTEEIRDPILYHHRLGEYDGEHKDLVVTVAVSNHFANTYEIGFSGNRYPAPLAQGAREYLAVDHDYFDSIEDAVNQEIEKARVFLQLAG
jgi:putative nucleotidyltransferase with HDIG domain